MLTVFDIDHSIGADDYDFKQLCPAFVQQAKSGACKQQSNQPTDPDKDMAKSKYSWLFRLQPPEGGYFL